MGRYSLNNLIFDNPILIKHVRSRLRRPTLFPGLMIVLVLCMLITWFGYMMPGAFNNGVVFGFAVALQGIILVIIGSSQIAGAVGKVRESNILDFHRISPLPPLEITLGFFLGGPILEYILWLVPLPLAAYASSQGSPGFLQFLEVEAAQLLVAWGFHGLALMTSMMTKKPKANVGGMIAFMFIVFGQLSGYLFTGAARVNRDPMTSFFGFTIHWLLFLALLAISALVFELIASTRKMRSDRAHALTKPQAVAFLITASLLLLGGFWGYPSEPMNVVVLYVQIVLGLVATVTITPDANEYSKGLRRAERAGHRHLPPWDDLALNRVGVMVLSLIVLVGSTLAWNYIGPNPGFGQKSPGGFSLAIAIGVLVVAYFGLAYQTFALMMPKRAATLMALFLFLAWAVPVLAGAITAAAGMSEQVTVAVMSISPVMGIGMASGGVGPTPGSEQTAQIAALMPAVIFFFLFNNLVTVYRRRVERNVQTGPAPAKPEKVESDALAVG